MHAGPDIRCVHWGSSAPPGLKLHPIHLHGSLLVAFNCGVSCNTSCSVDYVSYSKGEQIESNTAQPENASSLQQTKQSSGKHETPSTLARCAPLQKSKVLWIAEQQQQQP
jgi:hypothetical protein